MSQVPGQSWILEEFQICHLKAQGNRAIRYGKTLSGEYLIRDRKQFFFKKDTSSRIADGPNFPRNTHRRLARQTHKWLARQQTKVCRNIKRQSRAHPQSRSTYFMHRNLWGCLLESRFFSGSKYCPGLQNRVQDGVVAFPGEPNDNKASTFLTFDIPSLSKNWADLSKHIKSNLSVRP